MLMLSLANRILNKETLEYVIKKKNKNIINFPGSDVTYSAGFFVGRCTWGKGRNPNHDLYSP